MNDTLIKSAGTSGIKNQKDLKIKLIPHQNPVGLTCIKEKDPKPQDPVGITCRNNFSMIKPIHPSDISGLNRLSPPEWKMDYEAFLRGFIKAPFFYGFFYVQDGQPVSTGNVLIKDGVGWLANIIVDKDHRNQGLGYQMPHFLLDILEQHQCTTKLLLATELGSYVYKKLGFIKTTHYRSFVSITDQVIKIPNEFQKLKITDLPKVYQLDQTINGENRIHLLSQF